MSIQLGAKLKLLMRRAKLQPPQFVDEFAKFSGLRRGAIVDWLDDGRTPYAKNLEKLASYWNRLVPGVTAYSFLMPLDDFKRSIEATSERRSETGVLLPMHTNPLSGTQLTNLIGSYRLYRYDVASPTILCEAISISSDLNNAPSLRAELRSPLPKGVQTFVGAVIAMGERIYLILSDVDVSSSAMRFITMHGRFDPKEGKQTGIVSGAFEKDETISSMPVAIEKMSVDPAEARDEPSWLSLNAIDEVDKVTIIRLSTTKMIETK
jgi:hypothetical protein